MKDGITGLWPQNTRPARSGFALSDLTPSAKIELAQRPVDVKFIAVISCGIADASATFVLRNHTDEIATHLSISAG